MTRSTGAWLHLKVKERIYPMAILFAIAFALFHLISLPIGITYDGFQYIDLSKIVWSPRFPADWYGIRTPLFPLALKLSFSVFGEQPLAATFVSTVAGTGAVLLCGRIARITAGEYAAAAVLVLLTLFPTAVAYQHFVLTEAGTSFFFVLLPAILLWEARNQSAAWIRVLCLCLALTMGFYWRQTLVQLAPVVAVLHALDRFSSLRRRDRGLNISNALRVTIEVVLIISIPFGLSRLWDPYVDRVGLRNLMFKQGMARQAVLPVDHPALGQTADLYRAAIKESFFEGNFFSGVRSDLVNRVLEEMPATSFRDSQHLFFELIRQHPTEYLKGVSRTMALFCGAKALENENRIWRNQILSPTLGGAKLSDGPPGVEEKIKRDFKQSTTDSIILDVLWKLSGIYDYLLIAANIITVCGFVYFVLIRCVKGIILCALALSFMLLYAFILASIDRYAFPVYPVVLANLIIVPTMYWRRRKVLRALRGGSVELALPMHLQNVNEENR